LNHFAIDTSADGTFYAAGSFFDVVITAGTVDSISSVGSVVGSFTLRKTSTLKPTTAGRTLDVSSTGEAGIDWANVGSPTTTLNLSGTTISTTQSVTLTSAGVDAVWAKTMTALSSVPTITADMRTALAWVFTIARDKITQTATTQTLFQDDGTTAIGTSTVSDDGTTFTRSEWS
jgi:hypothetical protein